MSHFLYGLKLDKKEFKLNFKCKNNQYQSVFLFIINIKNHSKSIVKLIGLILLQFIIIRKMFLNQLLIMQLQFVLVHLLKNYLLQVEKILLY